MPSKPLWWGIASLVQPLTTRGLGSEKRFVTEFPFAAASRCVAHMFRDNDSNTDADRYRASDNDADRDLPDMCDEADSFSHPIKIPIQEPR